MESLKPYAKTIAAAAATGLIAVQSAISDSTVTGQEWITIALAVLGALGVFAVTNKPAPQKD